MKQKVNSIYKEFFVGHHRYVILIGGRGAGRSTVASQYVLARLRATEYFRCAIMRYILGDVRNSIYREITDRITEAEVGGDLAINDSLMTISAKKNTINAVGFKKSSGEQKSKLKSLANYNCVIIEEADEVSEADFMQLDDSLRTVKGEVTIILLLNPPPKSHWIIRRWFDLDPVENLKDFYIPRLKSQFKDVLYIRSSYKDNAVNIAPASVQNYENYQYTNPDHYHNMICGYVPEVVKGKIYANWKEIDGVPHEARLVRRGLDFGYSVDPSALVAVYEYNGGYIFDEELHGPGLTNKVIADTILIQPEAPKTLVIGDSAEPKSIDEIKNYGVNIMGAVKGTDSILFGIKWIQSNKISYTKRSKHIHEDYENYSWLISKDGKQSDTPKAGYDHTMDAIRYAMISIKPAEKKKEFVPQPEEKELYPSIFG